MRSDFFVELILLANGRLFVGGDIDDVVFGYYGKGTLHGAVGWIAESNLDYVREKASIGMTDDGTLTREWDCDAAIDDISNMEKLDDDATQRAIEMVRNGNAPDVIRQFIYDEAQSDVSEELGVLGMVISDRVIVAKCACECSWRLA